jgi:peptidoglycan/LPS O-acetylase OafA/YrhL
MRAIAVIAVMIYHADHDWLPGGFLGVEVFFVISGYLITLLLISEREKTGRVALGQFWLRRAKRLLPALFTMMALLVIYTAFFKSDALGQLRGDVMAGSFYVSNWYQIWVGAGYTAGADFAPLRHLWSLAVEEQFYLLWPLLMAYLLFRKGRRIGEVGQWFLLASVLVTIAIALTYHSGSYGTCDVTPDAYWHVADRCLTKTDTLYLSTPTRAGGLLIGAAFAMIWRPVAVMHSRVRDKGPLFDLIALVGLLGLAGLVWGVHLVTAEGADPWLFRGGFLLCGLATVMMISAVTHAKAASGKLLGNPVLLWIGTRSYGLYLYHWPIYQIIREQAGASLSVGEFVGAMALTVLVTEASYRFIETPIRTGRATEWWRRLRAHRDPGPRRIIATGGAMCVAVVSIAGVQMATAEVKQNEVAQELEQNQGAIKDPLAEASLPSSPSTTESDQPRRTTTTVASNETTPGTVPSQGTSGPPVSTGAEVVPPATGAPRTTTTAPRPPKGAVFAIGDSVMLGAANALTQRIPKITVNAEESRAPINGLDYLMRMKNAGILPNTVIVAVGANGPISDDEIQQFMEVLADTPTVVFLTVFTNGGYPFQYDVGPTNQRILSVDSYPNVIVLDWNNVGLQCPGDCYYDRLHLKPDGQAFYADKIAEAIGR